MSGNINDLMVEFFEPGAGESLNDAMRRYLGIDDDPTLNLQDAIAASDWNDLGGDALYDFWAAGPGGGDSYQSLIEARANKVSWWKLDETEGATADDAVGSNNGTHTGVAVNAASLTADGAGKAVAYDGSSSYTLVPHNASLTFAGDFSIELVARADAIPGSGNAWLAVKGSSYGLGFKDGSLAFLIREVGGSFSYVVAAAPAVDEVFHVVGRFLASSTSVFLYLNGALVASDSLEFGPNPNTNDFAIGAWPDGGEGFDGTVDEVVLYSAALSAEDILADAEAALGL